MKNADEMRQEIRESFDRLEESAEVVKENMRLFFLKMSKEEMLAEFRQWKDADLQWVCNELAMPAEDYEICQGALEVLKERGLHM